MSLYQYRKSNKISSAPKEVALGESKHSPNIWSTSAKGYEGLQNLTYKSKLASLVIPALFIIAGFYLIWIYAQGQIVTHIKESNGSLNQGNTSPVSYDYIDLSTYISNPEGLDLVSMRAFAEGILKDDPISNNFNETFYITIPSLEIKRLPVTPNVDSTTEEIYDRVLNNSLAHFENTGLPISDIKNNIVIYGHSAASGYNPRPSDPQVAFSFLSNLKVGDEIIIEINGEEHRFKMYKSKIVEPTDFSIINGERNRRTLTLFTCHPPGNNDNRLAIVARPI